MGSSCILCYVASLIGIVAVWKFLSCLNFIWKHHIMGGGVHLRKYGAWAIVTGASDGIGKQYAIQLSAQGFNVVLLARNAEKLKAVEDEIHSLSPSVEVKVICADFSKQDIYANIEELVQDLEVGILVNNVGVSYDYPQNFTNLSEEFIDNIMNVNCKSVVKMTKMILPQMVTRKRGIILNISSSSAILTVPMLTLYGATKAFVHSFSCALAEEHKEDGLIIQSVLPFFVATKMSQMRPSLTTPTAESYVKNQLLTIGASNSTFGFLYHTIQGYLVQNVIPKSLLISKTHGAFKAMNKKALKRQHKSK